MQIRVSSDTEFHGFKKQALKGNMHNVINL